MDTDDYNIYMTSIQEQYAARPCNLDNMCLAKFAVNYNTTTSGKSLPAKNSGNQLESDGEDGENDENDAKKHQHIINLSKGLGTMTKRKHEAIIQVKSYKLITEPEKYYYSRLMLYWPWHSEDDILGQFGTYIDHYKEVHIIVDENALHFNQFHSDIDIAMDNLAENGPPEIALDSIVPGIEEDNVKSTNAHYVMN